MRYRSFSLGNGLGRRVRGHTGIVVRRTSCGVVQSTKALFSMWDGPFNRYSERNMIFAHQIPRVVVLEHLMLFGHKERGGREGRRRLEDCCP
jgi:hypothetical protein